MTRAHRLAAALVLAALAAVALAAPARAGTFRVSQCAATDGSARSFQADVWSWRGGWPGVYCGPASGT